MRLRPSLRAWVFLCLLLITTVSFIFSGCRKLDLKEPSRDEALIRRFFAVPADASPQLKAIISDVKRQDEQFRFVEYFVEKNGWPKWESAKLTGKQQVIALIPFVKDRDMELNGYFMVKLDTTETSGYYELYRKSLYEIYSHSGLGRSMNPYSMQMIINEFNQKMYGIDTFRFLDEQEVPQELANSYTTPVDWQTATCKLKPPAISNNNSTASKQYEISCTSITTCYDGPIIAGDAGNHPPTCYSETYCYSSGGSGDGGWGPNPDPHGGGGGTGGNNPQNNPHWWQGGSAVVDDDPPPARDSIFYKNYLAKVSDSIRSKTESVFSVAQTTLEEWSFVLSGKDSTIHLMNEKTDNDPDKVTMNYNVAAGEKLLGEGHTHQNDYESYGYGASCSIDGGDLSAMRQNKKLQVQGFVSLVVLKEEFQAFVVEDASKAKTFFNNFPRDFEKRYSDSTKRYNSLPKFLHYRDSTLATMINMMGPSSQTGVGLYTTTDTAKHNWTKLN